MNNEAVKILTEAQYHLTCIRDGLIDTTERRHMNINGNDLADILGMDEAGQVLVHFSHVGELPVGANIGQLITDVTDFLANQTTALKGDGYDYTNQPAPTDDPMGAWHGRNY